MTICISAICEEGKKAVVALDRMLTSEGLLIEFEQVLCKINELSNSCVVTTAGDALEPKDILRDTKSRVDELTRPTVRQMADILNEVFISRRRENVENAILKPRGFKNIDEFYANMQRLPADVYTVLDNQIANFHRIFNTSMSLLLTGTDYIGAHIYMVYDPGRTLCFDSVGFHAIGSGTPHAISIFTSRDYTSMCPLNLTIWTTYEAKRRAEKAPGVGKGIDMCVIGTKVVHISNEVLSTLAEIYEKREEGDKTWLESIPQFSIEGLG